MHRFLLHNNNILDAHEKSLSAGQVGLLNGWGVFSTLRVSGGVPFAFERAPYRWTAFPMVDLERWLGFDIFCGFQDVYLMSLMFFLSGVFVWPSLVRKGEVAFLQSRFLRL